MPVPRKGVHIGVALLVLQDRGRLHDNAEGTLLGIAGKTTLLNVLACNLKGGTVEGTVLVNGQPMKPSALRKTSCYVLQRDVLLHTATVSKRCAETGAGVVHSSNQGA